MSIRIIGIGSIAGRPRYEVRDRPGKNADRKNGVRSSDVTGWGAKRGFRGRAGTLPKFCGKFFDQLELLFFRPLRRCMSPLTRVMADATAQRDLKLMLETLRRRRTFVLEEYGPKFTPSEEVCFSSSNLVAAGPTAAASWPII